MEWTGWKTSVKKIYSYFRMPEERQPDMQTVKMWFEMVSHIPDYAVPQVMTELFRQNDMMPRNVPKAVNDAHRAWRAAHPEKAQSTKQMPCGDCLGRGVLECITTNPRTGMKYRVTVRCGACENWKRHFSVNMDHALMPIRTRSALESEGKKVLPEINMPAGRPQTNVVDMVNRVGKGCPF